MHDFPDHAVVHDVDADCVFIDIAWPPSYGNLKDRSSNAPTGGIRWTSGFDVDLFAKKMRERPSSPGGPPLPAETILLPLELRFLKAGSASKREGLREQRMFAAAIDWAGEEIAVKVGLRAGWTWENPPSVPTGQRLVFVALPTQQLKTSNQWNEVATHYDTAVSRLEDLVAVGRPSRATFVFEAKIISV